MTEIHLFGFSHEELGLFALGAAIGITAVLLFLAQRRERRSTDPETATQETGHREVPSQRGPTAKIAPLGGPLEEGPLAATG